MPRTRKPEPKPTLETTAPILVGIVREAGGSRVDVLDARTGKLIRSHTGDLRAVAEATVIKELWEP
jgi:hypothetical protein